MALDIKLADAAGQLPGRRSRQPQRLILLGYLLTAVLLTWRLWANPAGTVPTNSYRHLSPDMYLNSWFMRYAATALAHGGLPALVTHTVNAPQGINVMWNTSLLLPSLLLAPVTLLAGPIVSLTVLSTLSFAGSAASLFYVLRRWGASIGAAAAGGALYGFSPALLVAAVDHYHLQFAVLPPLIIDAALRIVTGRGRPLRTGLWLGALVSAQLFIAEELLVDTALTGLVLVVVLITCRPASIRLNVAARTVLGLGCALAVVLLICGHALLVQFRGPLADHGSPWHIGQYGNSPADFVTAPYAVLLHGNFREFLTRTGQFQVELYAYLGWPMLLALAAIAFACWRDLTIRVSTLSLAVVELLSMGGHAITVSGWRIQADWLPWHWLWHLPVLDQVVVNRLSILADGLVAVVVALGIDRTAAAVRRASSRHRTAAAWAAAAVLAIVITPIIPLPLASTPVAAVPASWPAVIARLHLRPGTRVLLLPFDGALAMEWQAVTGEPISLVGGYCVAPAPNRRATLCDTEAMLDPAQRTTLLRFNWLATGKPRYRGPSSRTANLALSAWQANVVITVSSPHSMVVPYLIRLLGPATARQGDVFAWRLSPHRLRHRHG